MYDFKELWLQNFFTTFASNLTEYDPLHYIFNWEYGFPNGNREQITKEYFLEDHSITVDQKWKYRLKLILSNSSVEKNIYLVQS